MRFPEQYRVLHRITREDCARLLKEGRLWRAVERLADLRGRVNVYTVCARCCVPNGSLLENVCMDGVEQKALIAFDETTDARYAVLLEHFRLLTEPSLRFTSWLGVLQTAT